MTDESRSTRLTLTLSQIDRLLTVLALAPTSLPEDAQLWRALRLAQLRLSDDGRIKE